MCGISGIWKFNNDLVSYETLKRFTDSMVHRGPDGAGYELFDNNTLGLGQRRLSILDLSEAGKQPMSYAEGRYWIIYNGEIFNFIEVREELQQLGHVFKSDTDTEVILAAYSHWGKTCLDKFNGMWAFAIWDEQDKSLYLARDRFGIKPLYYTFNDHFIAFASETIAFKNLEGFERKINKERLKEIVDNSLAHEGLGLTIYDNIYQILPGHTLTIQKGKPLPKQKRWYDIRAKIKKPNTNSYEENVKSFYNLFENACKIRMRSDVPLASALSGGLDSSSVYSMVNHISEKSNNNSRQAQQCKKAITAVFPGTEMDEKQYAEVVAEKWGKENWVCISNNMDHLAQEIEQVTKKFDTIAGTPMNAITKIYEGVRNEKVIVSLDGHGVDEMLFGYRYMLDKLFYYYLEIGSIKKAILVKEVLVNLYHENNRESVSIRLGSLISQVEKNKNSLKVKLKSLLRSKKPKVEKIQIPNEANHLSDELYHFEEFSYENQIILNDFFIYSLPCYLMHFDRASMQNSVEIRMPFMDYRLVEFCFQLPIEHKLGMGYTKRIVRDALKEIVPHSIVERTFKVGIGSPLVSWFNNELNSYAQELLSRTELDLFLKELNFQDKSVFLEQLKNKTITDVLAVQLWQAINYKLISEFMQKTEAIQCSKCVLDTNDDPSLTFNSNGVCNHCQAYEKAYVLNPLSETQKQKYLEDSLEIIKSAKGKYQAILGLSGGVDSSYLVCLAKEWNIRVLLVHFDNGWNSELAVDNINRIVDYTGFDLYTHVVDWEEFKDLQLSYIKSSVLDWEVPTDHLIKATLFNLAKSKGIKSILSGTNHQTEFILPHSMRYNKADTDNINDIHQKFGTKPLKTTKLLSPLKEYLETKKHNIQFHPLLDFVYYNKDNAKETIIEKMGWRDYGGKHYESIFTRFYQGYVLPAKFGVDKRKAHLASLINSGQISKQEAIKELEKPSYPSKDILENDFEFVAKKFDLTNEELNSYINEKPIPHSHYKQYNTKNLKRFKKLEIYLNPYLYINYLKKKLKTT